jgi:uncharacterized membrane protein
MRTRIDAIADGLDRFITAERLKLYPRAILIGQVILIVVMIGIPLLVAVEKQALFPDFAAPWTGARFYLDGRLGELYDVHAQWSFQQEYVRNDAPSWFVSPPHVALVYSPLALVSFRTAGLIWTLISIVCVVASIRLIEPFAPRLFRNHRLATTLLLLSTYPIFELLGAGQQSAVTFLLLAGGIRLALADQQGWAGVLFALGAIKPQLFIMVPFVLIAMRMWEGARDWRSHRTRDPRAQLSRFWTRSLRRMVRGVGQPHVRRDGSDRSSLENDRPTCLSCDLGSAPSSRIRLWSRHHHHDRCRRFRVLESVQLDEGRR